jgi:SAM-dependent MidA family methyltransferase
MQKDVILENKEAVIEVLKELLEKEVLILANEFYDGLPAKEFQIENYEIVGFDLVGIDLEEKRKYLKEVFCNKSYSFHLPLKQWRLKKRENRFNIYQAKDYDIYTWEYSRKDKNIDYFIEEPANFLIYNRKTDRCDLMKMSYEFPETWEVVVFNFLKSFYVSY